jgi:hypothetical protein
MVERKPAAIRDSRAGFPDPHGVQIQMRYRLRLKKSSHLISLDLTTEGVSGGT